MLQLQLFKIRVTTPNQMSMFDDDTTSTGFLRLVIETHPSIELRTGYTWHIGNNATLGEMGLYFAFGRTTSSIVEMWNEENSEFIEVEFETAPYTHVILDLNNQIAAIAAKSRLAPTPKGIARNLEHVLTKSEFSMNRNISFHISALSDPLDFIHHLQTAHSVRSFTMSFSRPNPVDVEELYHLPMERLLQQTEGDTGETTLKGEDLDRETLEELARSVAAAGDEVKARIQVSDESSPVLKRMSGDAITISEVELETEDQYQVVLAEIRRIYRTVRESE